MRFDTYTIDAALRELLHKHVKMKKKHTTNNKQTNKRPHKNKRTQKKNKKCKAGLE